MAGGSGTTTAYHPTTQHQTHCQTPGWQSPRPRRMVRGPTPALEIVASFCKHIEQGHPWPNSTTHWRQLRIAKPGKSPNRISSSRPAQSWTGSGAHIESSSWHLGSNRSCRKSSMDVSKARAFTLLSYPTLLLLRPISAIPTKLKIIALWEVLASPRLSTDLRGNIALRQCNAWESLPESTMLLLQHGDNNSGGSLRLTTSAIGHTQLSVSHKATQRAQLACWLLCLKPTEESELLTLKINMDHNGIPFSLTTDFGSLREQALVSQLQERGNKLLPSSILEKTLAKLTSMRLDTKTMLRRCRTPSPSWSPRNHQTKDANLVYIHTTQLQSKGTYR